jgi:hypothetical protein
MAAMTQVPTLDLEARLKKESIGFPVRLEGERRFRVGTGMHQAARLGRNEKGIRE